MIDKDGEGEQVRWHVRRNAGPIKRVTRMVAGLVLFLWTTALVACSAHCFLGTSHLGMAQQASSCHAAPPPCHGGTPDEQQSDSGALCATLKQMSVEQHAADAPQPIIFVLFLLPAEEVVSGQCAANTPQLRRRYPAEWTAVPEVYLGAVNLPHAPPLRRN